MAFPIVFNSIIVTGQETNGTVSIGENQQDGWSAHAKQNVGAGMFFGINNTPFPVTYIFDSDMIDAPMSDNDLIPAGPQLQSL